MHVLVRLHSRQFTIVLGFMAQLMAATAGAFTAPNAFDGISFEITEENVVRWLSPATEPVAPATGMPPLGSARIPGTFPRPTYEQVSALLFTADPRLAALLVLPTDHENVWERRRENYPREIFRGAFDGGFWTDRKAHGFAHYQWNSDDGTPHVFVGDWAQDRRHGLGTSYNETGFNDYRELRAAGRFAGFSNAIVAGRWVEGRLRGLAVAGTKPGERVYVLHLEPNGDAAPEVTVLEPDGQRVEYLVSYGPLDDYGDQIVALQSGRRYDSRGQLLADIRRVGTAQYVEFVIRNFKDGDTPLTIVPATGIDLNYLYRPTRFGWGLKRSSPTGKWQQVLFSDDKEQWVLPTPATMESVRKAGLACNGYLYRFAGHGALYPNPPICGDKPLKSFTGKLKAMSADGRTYFEGEVVAGIPQQGTLHLPGRRVSLRGNFSAKTSDGYARTGMGGDQVGGTDIYKGPFKDGARDGFGSCYFYDERAKVHAEEPCEHVAGMRKDSRQSDRQALAATVAADRARQAAAERAKQEERTRQKQRDDEAFDEEMQQAEARSRQAFAESFARDEQERAQALAAFGTANTYRGNAQNDSPPVRRSGGSGDDRSASSHSSQASQPPAEPRPATPITPAARSKASQPVTPASAPARARGTHCVVASHCVLTNQPNGKQRFVAYVETDDSNQAVDIVSSRAKQSCPDGRHIKAYSISGIGAGINCFQDPRDAIGKLNSFTNTGDAKTRDTHVYRDSYWRVLPAQSE